MYRGKIDRARRRETTAMLEIYKWTHFLRLINNYLPKNPNNFIMWFYFWSWLFTSVLISQPRSLPEILNVERKGKREMIK